MQKRTLWLPRLSLVLAVVLSILLLWAGTALADSGGNSPVAVVPAPGRPNALRLRSQTVDITVSEGGENVWADTHVGLQISNPYTRTITSTLSLPGPELVAGDLPASLTLKLGDEALPLESADPPGKGLTTQLVMPPKSEVALELSYRQLLPESRGVMTVAYPLAASSRWGNVPESLRLTLSAELPLVPEQILGVAPKPQQTRAETLTWNWDTAKAPDVWVAFMSPGWWRKFGAARSSVAAPDAGPAQHLALSQMYQELAALPRLPFAPDADFYTRYYPLAIAELQAAAASQTAGAAPTAEQVTAHAALARLYHEQADRMGSGAGDVYLDLAATEAQAAIAGGANEPALRALAADAYVRLASIANSSGDAARAEAYLAKRTELEPSQGAGVAAEQKTARLALAENEVKRGDLLVARQIISDTFGSESIDIPALRAPVAGQALVTVETTIEGPAGDSGQAGGTGLAGKRKVTGWLVDGRGGEGLASLIGQAADAWRSVPGVTVRAGPDWVSIEYAFSDERQLAEIQGRITRMLPNLPELALMSAALSPETLQLQAAETDFQNGWSYYEAADLAPATDAWQKRADEVRAGSLRLAPRAPDAVSLDPTPVPGQDPAATQVLTDTVPSRMDLGDLQRAIWDANATAWENLGEHSYAQYIVHLGESGPSREWQIQAGSQRALEAEKTNWRTERLGLVAGAAGLAALLLAVILWRLL